jgi:large subunit ribosomal protein L5
MPLSKSFKTDIVPKLMQELGLKNPMEVPKLLKVSVNAGVGSFRDNKEALETFTSELADICGQKPVLKTARISEAGFKIKKGDVVGVSVTLRGERMWAFVEKFISVVLPRVRDFKGVSPASFDKNGNFSVGITEHTIFPEVNPNVVKGIRSLQVTFVTNNTEKEKSKALLSMIGMPFKKEE